MAPVLQPVSDTKAFKVRNKVQRSTAREPQTKPCLGLTHFIDISVGDYSYSHFCHSNRYPQKLLKGENLAVKCIVHRKKKKDSRAGRFPISKQPRAWSACLLLDVVFIWDKSPKVWVPHGRIHPKTRLFILQTAQVCGLTWSWKWHLLYISFLFCNIFPTDVTGNPQKCDFA